MRNFIEVLEAAKTPLFMWRAADDTSELNYIETLLALLLYIRSAISLLRGLFQPCQTGRSRTCIPFHH